MRRIFALLLLAAILALSACGQPAAEQTAAEAAPQTELPQETAAPTPAPGQEATSAPEEEAPATGPEAPAQDTVPVVYFTADISPEGLQAVYEALGWQPSGKLAVKVSTGGAARQQLSPGGAHRAAGPVFGRDHCGVQHRLRRLPQQLRHAPAGGGGPRLYLLCAL